MREKHFISALVADRPGVLQRTAGLFSRRGYNIDSVAIGSCEREGMSRIVVTVDGDEPLVGQICSQLQKLIDVIEVRHLNRHPSVARELMLVKLAVRPDQRNEVGALVDRFRCSIIDVGESSMIVQSVGEREKNEAFLRLIQPYGILEMTRTGETAMTRA
ncbi:MULTISPECIES: acetolactate synthase small subunit [Cohnella]|uniref:acetolactate synthase small subunit n=1 Tax=Cohnella TaxID=329857 RepID=UPI0009BB0453|nr:MULTISPECIES: acetolactate synthase small subunit [Cohnella]MBN2980576.1 acetolactate synthase small subunit [Cohnella algarum]